MPRIGNSIEIENRLDRLPRTGGNGAMGAGWGVVMAMGCEVYF